MSEQSMEDVFRDAAAAGEDQAQAVDEPADTGTEEAPPAEFVLGTYRSLEEAERGIAEKDRLILERANEVGDLRRQLAEQQAEYYQPPQQEQQWQPTADPSEPYNPTQADIMQVNGQIQSLRSQGDTDAAFDVQFNLDRVIRERQRWEDRQEVLRLQAELRQEIDNVKVPIQKLDGDKIAQTTLNQSRAILSAAGFDPDEVLHHNGATVSHTFEALPKLFQGKGDSAGNLSEDAHLILAQNLIGAEMLRRQSGDAQPRDAKGQFVPVQGGSGAEPTPETTPQTEQLEPGDPRLAFQHQVKRDAFGVIPSFDRA